MTVARRLHYVARVTALALLGAFASCQSPPATAANAEHLLVKHAEGKAAAEAFPRNFTGAATVTPIFAPTEQLPASGASVSFEPNARTAWHTHPGGQTLYVTSGTGWVQEAGGRKLEVKPGDVIWTPPGVKHWHGATSSAPMTHIAVQAVVGGKNVTWMEQVSDADYGRSP